MHILPQPWQPFACRVGGETEEVEVGEVGWGGKEAALRMQDQGGMGSSGGGRGQGAERGSHRPGEAERLR